MASAADPVGLPAAAEAAVESPILTVDELAALLRLNRKTVYDALSRGEIPGARRVGSTYRILRAAVIDWLASGQGRVSHSKRLK
ncbi:MAG: helix-turn-helix domain-containing protein [Myxococcales bacterium]